MLTLALVLASGPGTVATADAAAGAGVEDPSVTEAGDTDERSRSSSSLLGEPPETDVVVGQTVPVDRFAGEGRVATSVALAQLAWGRDAPTVIVASAAAYPDALSASALSGVLDAPVLLTAAQALSPEVEQALGGWNTSHAVIVGGPSAVGQAVADRLSALGISVERLAGVDRFATAVEVAAEVEASPVAAGVVYVVEGANPDPRRGWPDAVAVSAVAARRRAPILLTKRDALPPATAAAIEAYPTESITVVGGTAAVSESVFEQLGALAPVERVAGASRYATSAEVVDHGREHGVVPDWTVAVTGLNWPDALSAGSAAGRLGAALLLVDPQHVADDSALRDLIDQGLVRSVGIAGGVLAVSATVEDTIRELLALPEGWAVPFPEHVRVVSGEPLSDMVVEVHPDGLGELQVGGVLSAGPGQQAPVGVFGWVATIGQPGADGWVTVGLEAASIDDLAPEGHLQIPMPGLVTLDPVEPATTTQGRMAAAAGPLTCSNPVTFADLSGSYTADYDVLDYGLNLTWDADPLTFTVSPVFSGVFTGSATIQATGKVSCSKTLASTSKVLPGRIFPGPWGIPIKINPTAGLSLSFSASIQQATNITVEGTIPVTINVTYDLDNGFSNGSSFQPTGSVTTAAGDAPSMRAGLAVTGTVGFLIWHLAGAKLGPKVSLELSNDGCRNPVSSLDVVTGLTVGLDLNRKAFNGIIGEALDATRTAPPSHTFAGASYNVVGAGVPTDVTCNVDEALRPFVLTDGEVAQAYSQQFSVVAPDGSMPAATYAITSGQLPASLHLEPDGSLTGLPTQPGEADFVVEATFTHNDTTLKRERAYHYRVLDQRVEIITEQLPDFPVDQHSAVQIEHDSDRPVVWHPHTQLPDGLSLNDDGELSGTPTEPSSLPVTISAHFADGVNYGSSERTYTLTVTDAIPLCSDTSQPRAAIHPTGTSFALARYDPASESLLGYDSDSFAVHLDDVVTDTNIAPGPNHLDLSPGGRWLLKQEAGTVGFYQGWELYDLLSLQRRELPPNTRYWGVAANGTVAGSAQISSDGSFEYVGVLVPLDGEPQYLASPIPPADDNVYEATAYRQMPDGRIYGWATYQDEPGSSTLWTRLIRWDTAGAVPVDLSATDININGIRSDARDVPHLLYLAQGSDGYWTEYRLRLADQGTDHVLGTQAPNGDPWVTGTVVTTGQVMMVSQPGGDLAQRRHWLFRPGYPMEDLTPTLAGNEGWFLNVVLTSDGLILATVQHSGGSTTFRCIPDL